MTELILHIGTFKTGTTALQKYLSAQRDRLLKECGLLFPRAAEIPAGGHHNLVYEVAGSWKYSAERGGFSELEQEIVTASPQSVLVSAENLSSYGVGNPKVVPFFGDFAKRMGMPLKVVCYVRPQWEYMDSYYSQGVKSGYTTNTFDRFVESALTEPIYHYEQVIQPWEAFADEITVKPYQGNDFVAEFSRWLGIFEPCGPESNSMRRQNVRFGAKRLEFMRRLGAALERTRAPFKVRIPIAHRLRDTIMEAEMEDIPFSGLNDASVRRIHSHFSEENRKLSERFDMGFAWCNLPPGPFRPTIFDMADATEGDAQAFDDVIAKVLVDRLR